MSKKIFLLLIIPLLAFTAAHKFYVSVTNVNYKAEEKTLQITSRIFIDDMENVLKERYDISANLDTEEESELANRYIEKYLRAKFVVEIDGDFADYTILGRKYDNDIMVCYLEVPKVDLSSIKTIGIHNEVLTDMFDEQQNIVHIKYNGKKKSFVLRKGTAKGMLNL